MKDIEIVFPNEQAEVIYDSEKERYELESVSVYLGDRTITFEKDRILSIDKNQIVAKWNSKSICRITNAPMFEHLIKIT